MLQRTVKEQHRRVLRHPPELNLLLLDLLTPRRHISSSSARPSSARPQRWKDDVNTSHSPSSRDPDSEHRDQRHRRPAGIRVIHPLADAGRALKPIIFAPSFTPRTLASPVWQPREEEASPPRAETLNIITVANLPPGTSKPDLRPLFLPFGPIKSIQIGLGGVTADVAYTDSRSLTNVLRVYADRPMLIGDREIIMFRKIEADQTTPNETDLEEEARVAAEAAAKEAARIAEASRTALFVSGLAKGTTTDDLRNVFAPYGQFEDVVMRPGSQQAYVVYGGESGLHDALAAHMRTRFVVRGARINVERSINVPDTSQALKAPGFEDLHSIPGFRGSNAPSRVLWIGNMPLTISQSPFIRFFSSLGPVVSVRVSNFGFAHIEFATQAAAVRAIRAATNRGFRFGNRMVSTDFALWRYDSVPSYRALYIQDWKYTWTLTDLENWVGSRPGAYSYTILPPWRYEPEFAPLTAYVRFDSVENAEAASRYLDGRPGPDGVQLRTEVSSPPIFKPNHFKALAEESDEDTFNEQGLGFGARGTGYGALENGFWVHENFATRGRPPQPKPSMMADGWWMQERDAVRKPWKAEVSPRRDFGLKRRPTQTEDDVNKDEGEDEDEAMYNDDDVRPNWRLRRREQGETQMPHRPPVSTGRFQRMALVEGEGEWADALAGEMERVDDESVPSVGDGGEEGQGLSGPLITTDRRGPKAEVDMAERFLLEDEERQKIIQKSATRFSRLKY